LEKIAYANVEEVTELSDTARGAGGFGSSGANVSDLKRAKVEA